MALDASRAAFRAQLVIPEQRQLYDYWVQRCGDGPMPGRSAISPVDFPRLLPHVSLISIVTGPRRFRYRLAGTGLREIYDREVTGLFLDDIDWEGNADYWRAAHDKVADTGRPAQGVIRGLRTVKNHLVHFWLRLPLQLADSRPGLILCHDTCIPVSDLDDGIGAAVSGSPRYAAG